MLCWWKTDSSFRSYETLFQCIQNAGIYESSLLPIRRITIGHDEDILYETNSATIKTLFVFRYGNFETEFDKLMEAMDYYYSFLQNPLEHNGGVYKPIGGSVVKHYSPNIIINFNYHKIIENVKEEIVDWSKEGF